MKINTSIIIHGDIPTVWRALTQFENYSAWNRFMIRIEGEKRVGAVLTVEVVPPGDKQATFAPTLITYDENKEMRWVGILRAPWFFRGEHYFTLEKIDEQNTRFIHGEIFSGLFVPLFSALSRKKILAGFNLMNSDLKTEVEKNT